MSFSTEIASNLAQALDAGHLSEVLRAASCPDDNGGQSPQAVEVAIDLLLARLVREPENLSFVKLLGFVFAKAGLLGAALACYSRAIALAPTDLDCYRSKAVVLELLVAEKNMIARMSAAARETATDKTKKMTAIVLCTGESISWSGLHGVQQKPLISIDGEVLLSRTLRQIKHHDPAGLVVAVKQGQSHIFRDACGDDVKIAEIEPRRTAPVTPVWKYLSSCFHWAVGGRTICVLGDVWFSEPAMDRICSYQDDAWMAFGRSGPSHFPGHTGGSIFALSFANTNEHEKTLVLLDRLYRAGICDAPDGGWALAQLIRNDDPNIRTPGPNFEEINDFTGDFDTIDNWSRWMERYSSSKVHSPGASR